MAGLVLTYLSYYARHESNTELYPFFDWRLFSEPVGWDGASMYRVYASSGDGKWTRQSVGGNPAYSSGEYQNQLLALVERDPLDDAKLKAFLEFQHPDFNRYRIVSESFNPLELMKDASRFNTTTVWAYDR